MKSSCASTMMLRSGPWILLALLAGTLQAKATPTPTPTFTPTPEPTWTCAPCLTTVSITSISVQDDLGSCTDGDGLLDAGEQIGFTVRGFSYDSCCWYAAGGLADVWTTYPEAQYLGMSGDLDPDIFDFEHLVVFQLSGQVACMDEATFQFDAYADDGFWQDEDHQVRNYTLEVDDDGMGGYVCDDTPCGSTPEVPALGTGGILLILLMLGGRMRLAPSRRRR